MPRKDRCTIWFVFSLLVNSAAADCSSNCLSGVSLYSTGRPLFLSSLGMIEIVYELM
jgi:hypothetical protein